MLDIKPHKYSDAHIHVTDIPDWKPIIDDYGNPAPVCSCAHTITDWNKLCLMAKKNNIIRAFGIHPQNPDRSMLEKLENMLEKEDSQIDAIGEVGFDLADKAFAFKIEQQEYVWAKQLELCIKYQKPIIIHCRHALDRIFRDSNLLAQIPTVIFHSFSGSPLEARSLVSRKINAYFSFGKSILNNSKRAIACVQEIPIEYLLAETDAPYQPLKDQTFAPAKDIFLVYDKMAELRNMKVSELCTKVSENFIRAFSK